MGGADLQVCMPRVGVCSACFDIDEDGYGAGDACLVEDCADGDPGSFEGGLEFCDGRDNDCELSTDEDFNFRTDPGNCAERGVTCEAGNELSACEASNCLIAACDEGWADRSGGYADGCETDLSDPDLCGACGPLPGVPSEACGACESGSWTCQPDGTLACDGDRGPDAVNACGGCSSLESALGGACGPCLDAALACNGKDATLCVQFTRDTDGDGVCDDTDICQGGGRQRRRRSGRNRRLL